MIDAQNQKYINVTPPAALLDGASAGTVEIDTAGFDYLQYIITLGATDTAMTALAATESDTAGTGHSNITGLEWDAATSPNIAGDASTLPAAADDNKIFVMDINLLGRERFIDLTLTNDSTSNGGFVSVVAILSRLGEKPVTAAQRGAKEILRV